MKLKIAKHPDANIVPEQDGRYRVSLRLKLPTGATFNRDARFIATREKAREVRDGFYEEFNLEALGVVASPTAPQIGPSFSQWSEDCIARHWPLLVPSTLPDYTVIVRNHLQPRLGKMALTAVTPAMVRTALLDVAEKPVQLKKKGGAVRVVRLSVNRLKNVKTCLASCLTLAVKNGLLQTNPCNNLRMEWSLLERQRAITGPDDDIVEDVLLTPTQVDELLALARKTPVYWSVLLMAKMGLRVSEAMAVRPSDFDFEKNVLKVRRQLRRMDVNGQSVLRLTELKSTTSKRDVIIPRCVLKELKELNQDASTPLTHNSKGSWIEPRRVKHHWASITAEAKIKTGTHSLRRTFISRLLNDHQIPVAVVQRLVGHSTPQTTLQYYSKVTTANMADAIDLLN